MHLGLEVRNETTITFCIIIIFEEKIQENVKFYCIAANVKVIGSLYRYFYKYQALTEIWVLHV